MANREIYRNVKRAVKTQPLSSLQQVKYLVHGSKQNSSSNRIQKPKGHSSKYEYAILEITCSSLQMENFRFW
jgi:hypothetical protein